MSGGRLQDRVALVTGGTSGIGLAAARVFAAEGAQVIVTGRSREALEDTVASLGAGTVGVAGDVADPEHHARVAREIERRFGHLDVYLANAGINTITPSSGVSEAEYDRQFAVNTRGVFFGVQRVAPLIRDGGAIILTGSLASEKVLEGHAVYAGSKAALGAFARSWAVEFAPRRIRVNVLSPGPTDTAILGKLGVAPEERGAFERALADAIPLGRMARAEEIGRAALFLAAEASSFVTGINLRVDGGMALL